MKKQKTTSLDKLVQEEKDVKKAVLIVKGEGGNCGAFYNGSPKGTYTWQEYVNILKTKLIVQKVPYYEVNGELFFHTLGEIRSEEEKRLRQQFKESGHNHYHGHSGFEESLEWDLKKNEYYIEQLLLKELKPDSILYFPGCVCCINIGNIEGIIKNMAGLFDEEIPVKIVFQGYQFEGNKDKCERLHKMYDKLPYVRQIKI